MPQRNANEKTRLELPQETLTVRSLETRTKFDYKGKETSVGASKTRAARHFRK